MNRYLHYKQIINKYNINKLYGGTAETTTENPIDHIPETKVITYTQLEILKKFIESEYDDKNVEFKVETDPDTKISKLILFFKNCNPIQASKDGTYMVNGKEYNVETYQSGGLGIVAATSVVVAGLAGLGMLGRAIWASMQRNRCTNSTLTQDRSRKAIESVPLRLNPNPDDHHSDSSVVKYEGETKNHQITPKIDITETTSGQIISPIATAAGVVISADKKHELDPQKIIKDLETFLESKINNNRSASTQEEVESKLKSACTIVLYEYNIGKYPDLTSKQETKCDYGGSLSDIEKPKLKLKIDFCALYYTNNIKHKNLLDSKSNTQYRTLLFKLLSEYVQVKDEHYALSEDSSFFRFLQELCLNQSDESSLDLNLKHLIAYLKEFNKKLNSTDTPDQIICETDKQILKLQHGNNKYILHTKENFRIEDLQDLNTSSVSKVKRGESIIKGKLLKNSVNISPVLTPICESSQVDVSINPSWIRNETGSTSTPNNLIGLQVLNKKELPPI